MHSQILTYTGNGTFQAFDLDFDATAVFILPTSATYLSWHMPTMWVARTNVLGARETITSGVRIQNRLLKVATDASVNASGVAYTALILGAEDGDIEAPSWMGNSTAGRVISLMRNETPLWTATKRDNPLPAIVKIATKPAMAVDATTISDCVTLGAGTMTLADVDAVNQYEGTSTIGEGIDALVIYADSGCTIGGYTGNGAARNIVVGTGLAACLVWRTDVASTIAFFLPDGDGSVKTTNANAPAVDIGTLTDSGLALTGASVNASGGDYVYLTIPLNPPAVPAPAAPAILLGGRKALRLNGPSSPGYVDFGTGLNIDDEITLEWVGWAPGEPGQSDYYDSWLLGKVGGPYGDTAGNASWGLSVVNRITEFSHNWQGPMVTSVVSGRIFYASPISRSSWRTGVLMPLGVHLLQYVRRADGSAELWRDGVRVKQRMIPTDTLVSTAAHRVCMGARWDGSAYVQPSRMAIQSARVYDRGLTNEELVARAERALYASSVADVTSGLVADWDAMDIVGTAWADRAGSNHGTVTGGSIVDL